MPYAPEDQLIIGDTLDTRPFAPLTTAFSISRHFIGGALRRARARLLAASIGHALLVIAASTLLYVIGAPPAQAQDASFAGTLVSQNLPATMEAGKQYPITVQWQNTGTKSWTNDNIQMDAWGPYKAPSDPSVSNSWGASSNEYQTYHNYTGLHGPNWGFITVAPGEVASFTLVITAPNVPGDFKFTTALFDYDTGNQAFSAAASVTITPSVAFVSQTIPATMQVGKTYPVTVRWQNAGSGDWTSDNTYQYYYWPYLGSVSEAGSTTIGPGGSSSQQLLDASQGFTTVSAGGIATFTYFVTAPTTPGIFKFVSELNSYTYVYDAASDNYLSNNIDGFGPQVWVTVTPASLGGSFAAQSVPQAVRVGVAAPATVTMTNSGRLPWVGGQQWLVLGANPDDRARDSYGFYPGPWPTGGWGTTTVQIPAGTTVAPGASYTFSLTLTAPDANSARYSFGASMGSADGLFGAYTPTVNVWPSLAMDGATPSDIQVYDAPAGTSSKNSWNTDSICFYNSGETEWLNGSQWLEVRRVISGALDHPWPDNNWGLANYKFQFGDGNAVGIGERYCAYSWSYSSVGNFVMPATPGAYTLEATMMNASGPFGTPQSITVNATAPASAQFVSQSVPDSVPANSSFPVSVTMKNTGPAPWTFETLIDLMPQPNMTHLFPQDGWGNFWTGDQQIPYGTTVQPGDSYTFNWQAMAGGINGLFAFTGTLLDSNTGFHFDTPTPVTYIAVTGGVSVPQAQVTNVQATKGTQTGQVTVTWSNSTDPAVDHYKVQSSGGDPTLDSNNWHDQANGTDGTVGVVMQADSAIDAYSISQGGDGWFRYYVWACDRDERQCTSSLNDWATPMDFGYPNLPPNYADATLTATGGAASAPVTPYVLDPNAQAGQNESYTFAVLTQPAGGEGTATVVNNQLMWSPPAGGFTGPTYFLFTVTDHGGASVDGIANVNGGQGTFANLGDRGAVTLDLPDTIQAGQTYPMLVRINNTGHTDWTGTYTMQLAGDIAAPSGLSVDNWLNSWGFTDRLGNPGLGAANITTLTLPVTAPATNGTYTFSGQIADGSNSLLPLAGVSKSVTVVGGIPADPSAPTAPPSNVGATAGTITGNVRITWAAVGGAVSYNVYADGTLISDRAITAANFNVATNTATAVVYTVRSVNGVGTESADSAGASGYPNIPPTSTSAALTANSVTAATPVTPSTIDPNTLTGASETFTYTIATQPAAGQGTASVANGKLSWTPPSDGSFSGATSFTYSAADKAGATVVGTASVTVTAAAPNAPANLTASQGSVTGAVHLAWTAAAGAARYDVYAAGAKVNTAALTTTTYDAANSNPASMTYTVRAVSAAALESADSADASGYPNLAPTATSAALSAAPDAASAAVTPDVTDPNTAAGKTEVFTVTVTSQPSAGSASVVEGGLVWTPAPNHAFSGTTTFGYRIADKGGATVNGTATVSVSGSAPSAPGNVRATQGTLTNAVQVTWNAVTGAAGFNIYAAGSKRNTAPITGTAYTDYPVASATPVAYTVRNVNGAGGESTNSTAATGYANIAPTSTSATLTANASANSAAVAPVTVDANVSAGQSDAFTYSIVGQPPAGEGSAVVMANKLVWSPPSGHGFVGTTSFTFRATDRGGAAVTGTASVSVTVAPAAPATAPGGLAASQGTVTNAVRLSWLGRSGASSYNAYQAGVKLNTEPITGLTYDAANTSVTRVSYTVRSVNSAGAESADSVSVQGYPNIAPTATSVHLTASTLVGSVAVAPTVEDPNVAAGEAETFTVTITDQPSNGTASVSASKLAWTPGTGSVAGVVSFGYSVTDKGGASVSGTATVTVSFVAVAPVAITFAPSAGLVPVNGGNYLTYSGTNVAGMVTVTGPVGGMTARISLNGGAVQSLQTTGTSLLTMVKTENAVVGTAQTYHIEVTPTKGVNSPTVADYSFDVKPRGAFLLLRPLLGANSSAPATVTASLGLPAIGGAFTYDAGKQGAWSVQLYSLNSRGVKTPVSTPVTSVGTDGALSFDVGILAPGFNLFTAEATQTDAPAGTTAPVLKSGTVAAYVRDGTAIEATLITKPATGPAPLHGNVGAWPVNSARLADIGEVQVHVSDDGSTGWTRVVDAKNVPTTAIFTAQVLTGESKKFYKATVKNRWSGLTTDTTVGTLQSFIMPALHIEGSKATLVTRPVTLTAVADNMDASTMTFTWEVRYGVYDNNPTTYTGPTMTFTPSKAGTLSVVLAGKQTNAPEGNALATKVAYYSVLVVPPKMPNPSVTGPTIVEVGKAYTWTGIQPPPFPTNLTTDLVVKSQWIMPDGTIQTGNPVTYTMKAGDQQKVRFESWFDGYTESLSFGDHVLQPWTYQWPAMAMRMTVLSPYAPARVQYTAGLASAMNISLLHGETLGYAWSFPQGATVISQSAGTAVVEYPTVGTYQASAVISDSRGNSSTVTSDAVVVLPTRQLEFNLTLASSDRWNRPPGPVMARTQVTQLPLNDAPAGVTFFVDGTQVGSEVPAGANLSLPTPGTYSVRAVFRSVKGATAEVTQAITMATGDDPVCTLKKNGNGTTSLWFQATCTVQRGNVVGYTWKVNGTTQQVSSNTLSFTATNIASASTIEVTATTDKGQKGGALYNIGSGGSVPVNP